MASLPSVGSIAGIPSLNLMVADVPPKLRCVMAVIFSRAAIFCFSVKKRRSPVTVTAGEMILVFPIAFPLAVFSL